jgi:hypothetical protein
MMDDERIFWLIQLRLGRPPSLDRMMSLRNQDKSHLPKVTTLGTGGTLSLGRSN